MSARDPLLEVEGLVAGYGKAVVLEDATLHVGDRSVVGIAGANGVGKTTLLRAITGTVKRSSGALRLGDRPLPASPLRVTRMGVAHVPEGRQLFPNLSVRENLRIGAIAGGRKQRSTTADRLCDVFPGLRELLPRKAGLLSGGQQQLVAVARGFAAEPRLLLIDELSLGLSPIAAEEITTQAVAACREQGMTLVMVDQNVRLLARHCDVMHYVRDGCVHALNIEDVKSGLALF